MTSITEFNRQPCPSIDATEVNAYFDLSLSESDKTKLVFDNSWGTQTLDLTPAIKAGETITHLMLDPTDSPVYLRFDNEAGDSECIHGNDLSRIISMKYLKDVAQGESLTEGDIYMFGSDLLFHRFSLQDFMDTVNSELDLTGINNRLTVVEQDIYQIKQDIVQIKAAIQDLYSLIPDQGEST